MDYLRDPQAIYAESFGAIRVEARLESIDSGLHDVVIRMIHACGMVDLAEDFAASPNVVQAAGEALRAGGPVLCDCEMVRSGIVKKALPNDNETVVTLNDPRVPDLAKALDTTRSAAAVDLWSGRIEGAVVVIGNAPTALFRLLELLADGAPRPAAIIATPVGFVGAAESKQALIDAGADVPFVTVRGRRGGSAIASAAFNAIGLGVSG